MNNTRQIIKLDLSGLQTETSVNQYQSFPTPKLNELLYNFFQKYYVLDNLLYYKCWKKRNI